MRQDALLFNLIPFKFLFGKFVVLLVHDDPDVTDALKGRIEQLMLFTVLVANTIAEAEEIIRATPRIHVCVLDLGMPCAANDQLYLCKKYSHRIPFIVYTDRDELENAIDSKDGCAQVFVTKSKDGETALIHAVCCCTLINAFNWAHDVSVRRTLRVAVEQLVRRKPADVNGWLQHSGVVRKTLEEACNQALGNTPLDVLELWDILVELFAKQLARGLDWSWDGPNEQELREDIALEERYLAKMKVFDALLANTSHLPDEKPAVTYRGLDQRAILSVLPLPKKAASLASAA